MHLWWSFSNRRKMPRIYAFCITETISVVIANAVTPSNSVLADLDPLLN